MVHENQNLKTFSEEPNFFIPVWIPRKSGCGIPRYV